MATEYIIIFAIGVLVGFAFSALYHITKGYRAGLYDAVQQIQPYHLAHAKLYGTLLDMGKNGSIVVYLIKERIGNNEQTANTGS